MLFAHHHDALEEIVDERFERSQRLQVLPIVAAIQTALRKRGDVLHGLIQINFSGFFQQRRLHSRIGQISTDFLVVLADDVLYALVRSSQVFCHRQHSESAHTLQTRQDLMHASLQHAEYRLDVRHLEVKFAQLKKSEKRKDRKISVC